MNLYPAIDILGGNAVRLVKGDFDAKKVYDQDPLSAARAFAEAFERAWRATFGALERINRLLLAAPIG